MGKARALIYAAALTAFLTVAFPKPTSSPVVPSGSSAPPASISLGGAAMPAGSAAPGADQVFDGIRWRSYYWAADQLQVAVKQGTDPDGVVPGARFLEKRERDFRIQLAPVDRAGFSKRAREVRACAGVEDALPVFFASSRFTGPPLILTRQVLATLPAGGDPVRVAARFGVRLVERVTYMADTVLLQTVDPLDSLALATELLETGAARVAMPQFAMRGIPFAAPATVNDPLYGNQWHLRNVGQGGGSVGEDVRVESAWNYTMGAGATIGILDTGLQGDHPDLAGNLLSALGYDFNDNDWDPSPVGTEDHGTAVAGLAAAVGNNGVGVSGVAPQAKLVAFRLLGGLITDSTVAAAMSQSNGVIQIKNNSWGFTNGDELDNSPHFATLATIADQALNGRGGRGTVYVFSGGNLRSVGGDANQSSFCAMRQAIAVGASNAVGTVASFSNTGACLLVCAPSGDDTGPPRLETADRTGPDGYNASGDYTGIGATGFGGTSGAAPVVSGVVALMLSANADLKARDVKHVLVRTARKVDLGNPSWMTNGGGRLVSRDYGHGVVDAAGAVQLAKAFPYAPGESVVTMASPSLNLAIPDSPDVGVSHLLTLPAAGALRVEHVEVVFNATHSFRGDLRVRLVHGSTTSVLADLHGDAGADYDWKFMSTLHWGESSAGDWTLLVDDLAEIDTGTFNAWTLRVYGTPIDTTGPVPGTVRDGTGADLALQSSPSMLSANWSGFSDPQSGGLVYEWAIGTSPGATNVLPFQSVGYATSATATGLSLTLASTYYVLVRATNFEGLQSQAASDGVVISPETSIVGSPANPSGVSNPVFTFSANAPGCTFSYQVDGGPILSAGAATSVALSGLGLGTHVFSVFATDAGGVSDPTPATYTWEIPMFIVDGVAPLLNPMDSPLFTSTFSVTAPTAWVGWAVDASPAAVSGAPPYFTGPRSLNYNNAANYFTGGRNSGAARTPAIDVSGLFGTRRLKFMCNYETDTSGTATDARTVTIWKGDLSGTWTAPIQLHGGASPLGPCAAMGAWHEHTIDLQPSWVPDLRVEFMFDTVDAANNVFAGWFIDDLEISDLLVSALSQNPAGGAMPIPVGGSVTSGALEIRGIVSQAGFGVVQLEVEVQPAGVAFTGIPTGMGAAFGPGAPISIQFSAGYGSYHWRARTVQASSGTTSAWMEFGLNDPSAADFSVVPAPAAGGGSGGGGGCGALGIGAFLPLAIAAWRRRRR